MLCRSQPARDGPCPCRTHLPGAMHSVETSVNSASGISSISRPQVVQAGLNFPTAALITAIVNTCEGISDLIFSPGRPPQVEANGRLVGVNVSGLKVLTPADTAKIAAELLEQSPVAAQ